MRKLKLKGIVIVTSLAFILTGCQAKQSTEVTKQEPNTSIIEQIEEQNKPTVEQIIETPVVEDQPVVEQPTEEDTTKEEQTKEFTFFKDAKQEIISYIESEDFEKLKEKGKYYITTAIDFIFFDQPINGIYFDQMTEELKKDIIRDVKSLDEAIMAYYPDYKEDISSKYQIASEFIGEKYLDVLDAIKEYLGEENYNAIGAIKNQIKEDISTKTEEGIGYIKDFYNNWKNK